MRADGDGARKLVGEGQDFFGVPAWAPDGSKIYTVNPYSAGLNGELEVFAAGKPDAIGHPKVGINPYAIAIQPK